MYMISSLGLTAAAARAFFKSGLAMRIAAANPFLAFGVSIAALIGTQMVTFAIPYEVSKLNSQIFFFSIC
jgi:growth hormone-inducible transmembrane protein